MTTDPTAAPTTGSTAVTPGPPATGRPDPADSSTGELLRTLTENLRSLVQGEVASVRAEMTEKALAARPAAAMLGGAAVLGVLAAGTSATVLVRALDRFLPPTTSAVVATALLGGGAAALARAGAEELRRVGPPVPGAHRPEREGGRRGGRRGDTRLSAGVRVYFFELLDGQIIRGVGVEENLSRMQQLGYGQDYERNGGADSPAPGVETTLNSKLVGVTAGPDTCRTSSWIGGRHRTTPGDAG